MLSLYLLKQLSVSNEFYHELTLVTLTMMDAELCRLLLFSPASTVYPELTRSSAGDWKDIEFGVTTTLLARLIHKVHRC